jgi:hypothetical protein
MERFLSVLDRDALDTGVSQTHEAMAAGRRQHLPKF